MKVLVCGGRGFHDLPALVKAMDAVHRKHKITLVIHGGCAGADLLSTEWAELNRVHCAEVKALWKNLDGTTDRAAGPKRNRAMLLLDPDAVIAFPGGRGTSDMVNVALEANIPVWRPLG